MTEIIDDMPDGTDTTSKVDQEQLARDIVEQARAQGIELVGPAGLLTGLTKTVLETALEAEMSEHLVDQLGMTSTRPRAATGPTPATGPGPRRC